MRIRDVKIGQTVAVSRGLAAKHINIATDEERWLALGEHAGLAWAASDGPADYLARFLRDGSYDAWNLHHPPHKGVVRDVGLWWGGRKAGVLVEIVDFTMRRAGESVSHMDRLRRVLEFLGADRLEVVVPVTMIEDYWDCLAELAVEASRWAERRAARIQARGIRIIDLTEGGAS